MTTSQESFYSSIDGALTPEQAAQALAMAASGDTGDKPEPGGAPATTAAPDNKDAGDGGKNTSTEQAGSPTEALPEDQQNAANTVVLARDGKHTISFDEVQKIRRQRDEAIATAGTVQQQLAALQAQAEARAAAGEAPTNTDTLAAQTQAAVAAGADVNLFGDFSEEAMAAGIQKLIDQKVAAQVEARVADALKPLQAKQQRDAATEHYDAIYGKHPDADSIAQSVEFKAWVDSQPSVVCNAYWGLFDPKTGGSAAEIVEVFDAYKAATEKPSSQPTTDPKAVAKAVTEAVRAEPPSSLTSIPGGRVDGLSPDERMAELSGVELHYAMEGKTPEQINAWLNKQM